MMKNTGTGPRNNTCRVERKQVRKEEEKPAEPRPGRCLRTVGKKTRRDVDHLHVSTLREKPSLHAVHFAEPLGVRGVNSQELQVLGQVHFWESLPEPFVHMYGTLEEQKRPNLQRRITYIALSVTRFHSQRVNHHYLR